MSPTIFIILLSDIELWCPGATLCGYADDTSVTIIDKDMDKLKTTCEEKVNELLTYMAINKLAANDDKTKILVMRHGNNKEEQTFSIGDSKVEESKEEKLLGVWVANDLQWSKHLEEELRFRLYKLRKLEQSIPKSLLKKVANGISFSFLHKTYRDCGILE